MEPQPEHVLIARKPQTSQSGSAFGGGRAPEEGAAGLVEAAGEGGVAVDERAPAAGTAGTAGEGGVGGVDSADGLDADELVAAIDGCPPVFFVIGW